MSTATLGTRVTHTQSDPEDIRVGKTLTALMFAEEMTPEGYINRRRITHGELAKSIRLPGRKAGVDRTYIAHLCGGKKRMNNDMLFAIARVLKVDPIAIKIPDGFDPSQASLFGVDAA
jgi:hypothetical protein